MIKSWLCESDKSLADENDYIQSNFIVSSEDKSYDGEKAPNHGLNSAYSENEILLSHISSLINLGVRNSRNNIIL